ncbi:hypothetical protein UFOVP116_341 [uncultured Caudovirales phage]|uniref:Uncharacterized protein n=1 Tax=uncultured Caudovirales phage TaxID=2100421 RepID=A0A6J5LAC0_9CAUD|nr:hypothetical protein UFOVP116_341 [uncultured Caudovirales phage]
MSEISRTSFNEGFSLGLIGGFFDRSRRDYTSNYERGYWCGRDRLSQHFDDIKKRIDTMDPLAEDAVAFTGSEGDISGTTESSSTEAAISDSNNGDKLEPT